MYLKKRLVQSNGQQFPDTNVDSYKNIRVRT